MINFIKKLCFRAIVNKFPKLHKQITLKDIDISQSKEQINSHFQFNSAMKISKMTNDTPTNISNIIKQYIEKKTNYQAFNITLTDPGFLNFIIQNKFIDKKLTHAFRTPIIKKKEKIIIDYSSPNIAKDMHVGHLRSTIIGDCLSRILLHLGHKVIKISHLGDWGTQFGVLISYIKENYNYNDIKHIKLEKLSSLYQAAQKKFETNQQFKDLAKKEVINLQKEDKTSINIWNVINHTSKKEYKKIYTMLDITIKYKGESFYKDLLRPLINNLQKKKIIINSDNAKCIYLDGYKNKDNNPLPLIVRKSDGGFNYATTDLAAIYYRIKYNKADKIIYITDIGQKMHFEMIFKAIEKTTIKTHTKLIHLPIGLMLTHEGKKIKTRSGQSEKLLNLLKNAIKYAKKIIIKKNPHIKKHTLLNNAKIIGINTIKYSDLSNKIDQNYIFDYNKILQFNGNTSSFLNYAYVRIISIKKNFKKKNLQEKNNKNIKIETQSEINLAIHILQYKYTLEKTAEDLNPNILTTYLYKLAEKFHAFFHECNVIDSHNKHSRLSLCKITEKILKNGMLLLGLKIIKKM